ncbi:uncharacterized protein A4U43_C09F13480 [Asparagus officinalis]|uniref:Uncharacterized protein n=1 Tax=Asparagus officinalis TaxID=4686 RepID=A0A5P1E7E3_ASPOF|nr:uncharacterized protein A4U43_C09F13480 [Asparagus officinalis]
MAAKSRALLLTNLVAVPIGALFFLGNEGGNGVASSSIPSQADNNTSEWETLAPNENVVEVVGDDEVRAPLPVKRETLYGDASFARWKQRNIPNESPWVMTRTSSSSTIGLAESLINRRKNRSNRNSDEIRQKKSARFSDHSVLQRRIRSLIKTQEIPTQDEIFIEFGRGER